MLLQNRKLLIVDDDATFCRNAVSYFERKGTVCRTTDSAKSALAIWKEWQPDVGVIDLILPGSMTGDQLISEIVSTDPRALLLMRTAYPDRINAAEILRRGAFDFMTVRVGDMDELCARVKRALIFRQKEQEARQITVLERYFDPRIFDTIRRDPDLLALRAGTLTVCFWDIRGFSALSDILSGHPQDVSEFLRQYFQCAEEAVFTHEGVLDKFIGDGVMALFGALDQEQSEHSVRKAVVNGLTCALVMRDRFEELLPKWTEKWRHRTPKPIEIGLGCGIHTGEVLVGKVGTETRDQYTALGTNVNIAQRLESAASARQVLVSASTEVRVRESFAFQGVGTIPAKNIGGIVAFSVVGAHRALR